MIAILALPDPDYFFIHVHDAVSFYLMIRREGTDNPLIFLNNIWPRAQLDIVIITGHVITCFGLSPACRAAQKMDSFLYRENLGPIAWA